MTHPSDETLVALADGELTGLDEERTRRHVDACTSCTAAYVELADARTVLAGVLDRLDASEPGRWNAGSEMVDAVRARVDVPRPLAQVRSQTTAWRWAAGLVLLSGAAAAAIMTPVLIRRVSTDEVPTADAAPAPQPTSVGGAVAVAPLDGRVDVALSNAADGSQIFIAFHARPDVSVDVSGASGFVARDGHIGVDLRGERAVLRVTLPHDLQSGRILVGGEPAAVIERGKIMNLRTDLGVVIDSVAPGR